MKTYVKKINATPSKRLFLSIISDYDLKLSICELVDNAIDSWIRNNCSMELSIKIAFDIKNEKIIIIDNAGGVKEDELFYLVAPGQTGNNESEETIGIFGVGTKRAVVAIAKRVNIKSRYADERTFSMEFDDNWILDDEWLIEQFEENDGIDAGTTVIELDGFRKEINKNVIQELINHLAVTYSLFIDNYEVNIVVDDIPIKSKSFNDWSYPEGYEPRKYISTLPGENGNQVKVKVIAGLASESSPTTGEYGVYFYCNNRLIARALKTYEVGFTAGLAGRPHPTIALTRVIIFLEGVAKDMPWNSSKSNINPNHYIFKTLRDWFVYVVKDYSSISRRWAGEWDERVFSNDVGEPVLVEIDDILLARKSFLPPLPKTKPKYIDVVNQANKKLIEEKPWIRGIFESVLAIDIIDKQKFVSNNMINIMFMKNIIEYSLKEYLLKCTDNDYEVYEVFDLIKDRNGLINEFNKYIDIGLSNIAFINEIFEAHEKYFTCDDINSLEELDVNHYLDKMRHMLNILFNINFMQ